MPAFCEMLKKVSVSLMVEIPDDFEIYIPTSDIKFGKENRYQHRFAVYLQPRGKLADPEIYLEVVLLQDPGLEAHRKKLKIN